MIPIAWFQYCLVQNPDDGTENFIIYARKRDKVENVIDSTKHLTTVWSFPVEDNSYATKLSKYCNFLFFSEALDLIGVHLYIFQTFWPLLLYCILLYCIVLYCIWWGGPCCPMHCDLFKIYCAPLNLDITRTWICRLNFFQRPILNKYHGQYRLLD